MLRAFIRWTGGPMGVGLSVFNLESDTAVPSDVTAAAAAIDQGLAQWQQVVPSTVTMQVLNEMELRDTATGTLTATVTGTAPAPRAGAVASGAYAAGVGGRVRWNTDGVRNGRPVKGTTFIVPMATTAFESNGTITSVALGRLQDGANAILPLLTTAECVMGVWSKPTAAGASDGVLHPVISAGVPDQASWLTSRRQ